MENGCVISRENGEIELPPGFRFHPTDEELITYYLSPKVIDSNFCAGAVGEVDLNKVEPWDLPWKAKMGEKEWYFFCVRDRKYPTGLRTNRATDAGYWKATGKDKEIHRAKALVGMKKTLVFYKGRAPKGEKTNWVMHEYRLEGKHTNSVYNLPKNKKNEWVISRIFKKGSGGKKMHISGLVRFSSYCTESKHSDLPPLLHLSSSGYEYDCETKIAENSHVTCFSETVEDQKKPEEEIKIITPFASLSSFSAKTCDEISSCTPSLFSKASAPSNSFFANQIMPQIENILYPDSFLMQEQQSMLRLLLENNVSNVKPTCKAEFSLDTTGTGMSTDISSALSNHQFQRAYVDLEYHHISTSASAGPLDSLWNY